MLSYIEDITSFKHWFFGHYHLDANLGDKYTAVFHNVIAIE